MELDYYLAKYGKDIWRVVFMDDLFNVDKQRVRAFCTRIKHYGLTFTVQVRMDKIDQESITLLKDAGCNNICFGLESASDRVLKSMKKQMRISDIKEKMDMVLGAGMHLVANLIFGDIAENMDTVRESMEFYEAYYQRMGLFLLRIETYPGTHLFRYAMDKGIINDELAYLRGMNPFVNVSGLTRRQYEAVREMCNQHNKKRTISLNLLEGPSIHINLRTDGSFDYGAICPHCFTEQLLSDNTSLLSLLRPNMTLEQAPKSCARCGKLILVPGQGNMPVDPVKAEAFFASYAGKRIAVYGLGYGLLSMARVLLLCSQTLRDCLVKVVDREWANMSDQSYCGLRVENPETLRDAQFDYVIIGATAGRNGILAALRQMDISVPEIEIFHTLSLPYEDE
jgi:hypothetical protein